MHDQLLIARPVEIKSLLGKMKQLNENLPADLEEFLDKIHAAGTNEMLIISGANDLPKNDDIGERRRKHELVVLARAGGIEPMNEGWDGIGTADIGKNANMGDDECGTEESEDEF